MLKVDDVVVYCYPTGNKECWGSLGLVEAVYENGAIAVKHILPHLAIVEQEQRYNFPVRWSPQAWEKIGELGEVEK